MKVSVVIPVYNVERYLARCLDSVLASVTQLSTLSAQPSVEIICVNDGSTDGSAKILEHYSSTFNLQSSTFSVIKKLNGGLGSARNAGLDVATGDYIMFVDSDDWIPAPAIPTFVSVAGASKALLVVSSSFLKDTRPETTDTTRAPATFHPSPFALRPSHWIAGKKVQYSACNKLYAAELLRDRRFGATLYEDFPFTTGVFCDVDTIAVIDEPLYVYCSNAGAESIVRSAFSMRKLESSLSVVREVMDYARDRADDRRQFAMRQAADGMSSTVGQVYKSRDSGLRMRLGEGMAALSAAYPELRTRLSLKARFRLWRMGL